MFTHKMCQVLHTNHLRYNKHLLDFYMGCSEGPGLKQFLEPSSVHSFVEESKKRTDKAISKDSRHLSLHERMLRSTRHFIHIHISTAPWACDQIVIGFLPSNYWLTMLCKFLYHRYNKTMHQSKSNNFQHSIEKHQSTTLP